MKENAIKDLIWFYNTHTYEQKWIQAISFYWQVYKINKNAMA